MSDDVQQLLEKYLDDRDQLSDGEIAMMVVSLRKSPELASQLKEQLLLNEYLGQRFGVDRQNFVAQVEQRIRDVKVDEEEIDEQVGELRTLAENELENWNRRNRRAQKVRFWIGSALLVLIAAGLGAWYVWAPSLREIATVISVIGNVRGSSKPSPGEKIMPGDEFRTAKDQYITFQYSDGTMIQVGGNSSVQFPANYTGRGKQLLINRGNVAAKVQPQKSGGPLKFVTPIAVAEVLGTELFLSVGPTGTRLDVTEGTVKLTNTTSGNKSVRVMAGNYGVATKKEVTVQPVSWPSNRDGLAFLFQAADEPNFAKDWISGLHRRCFVESQGLAGINGQVMSLANGSFRPLGVDNSVRKACRETNQLTIEAVIQADEMQQCDPARIITFSTGPDSRNFSLSQTYNKLTFQIRTSQSAADHLQLPIEICQLPDENPHHFVLAYKSGRLVAYLDGQLVCDRPEVRGDFSNWSRKHLLFGAEHGKIHDWSGKLEGIAIYNRFMNADEAEHNSKEYRKLLDDRNKSTTNTSTE